MTLLRWTAAEAGTYSMKYTLTVPNNLEGRLGIRIMLFNANGTFAENMLAETYDVGQNGQKLSVTLTRNDLFMTEGQYILAVVYDENTPNATATVNMQISSSSLYKGRLNALIAKAEAVDANLYTPASYEALTTALTAAKAQVEATEQVDINKAVQALEKAMAELTVLTIDTDALSAAITEFEALLDGDYTAASVAVLSAKIDEAKLVVENPESQEAVDAALQALQVAKGGLVDLSALRSATESLAAVTVDSFVSSTYAESGMTQVEATKASASAILAKEDATKDEINTQITAINNALVLVNLVADMNQDFSKVQGENGWRYQTNTAHVWDWGTNYGPTEIVDLVWNNATQQYESAAGSVVKGSHMAFPQTWNNAMTLLRWTAPEAGTYNMTYTLTVPSDLGGRLGIRIMLFNADGTFALNMLAETFDVGLNGNKLNVTLSKNDIVMTEGQYILAVVYDENTPNATATVNMQISSSSLYKGRLNALIAKAEAVDGNLYTPASYEALTTALTAAKAQVEATEQVEINKAVQALEKAMAELTVLTIDTDALSAAMAEFEALLDGDYTAASVAVLSAKIDEAKLAIENPESQEAVDAALQALQVAKGGLVDLSALRSASESLAAIKAEHFVSSSYVEAGMAQVEAAKASVSAILAKEDASKDEINAQINIANEALTLVHLVADMNQDFSKVQGENGWRYQTNTAHNWGWGASYGPTEIVDLVWNNTTQQYESAAGSVVKGSHMAFPQTWNNAMTLLRWTAAEAGTYNMKYTLTVPNNLEGRLGIRIMLFNANGTFAENMLAETYDVGQNGQKLSVTLTRNELFMTEGQYILAVVYDENTPNATATVNMQISSSSLYKGRLNALIAKAEAVDANLYTPASYEALTTALTAAKAQLTATEQVEINKAVQALEKAMAELTLLSIDTDALSAAIAEAQAVVAADYTVASYNALQAQIEGGQALVANPSSKDAVDAKTLEIYSSINSLVSIKELKVAYDTLNAVTSDDFVNEAYVEDGLAKIEAAKTSVSEILAKEDASKDEVNAQIQVANDALAIVRLVADMNKDFSSTQGENGWYYVTNDGHVWDWGANYGPQNLVELTWDEEQNAYVSEFGNKVTSDGISYPLTGNNHMTLVKWTASADGTYDLKYNLNVGDGVGAGRLSVRIMRFNADGTFVTDMVAETYDIGTNGNKCDVTLTRNDIVMTAGQYIVVAVYDENSCSAEGTCNLTILK